MKFIANQMAKNEQKPSALVSRDHLIILQAWQCVLGPTRVIYLSGPITTGLRSLASLREGVAMNSDVIKANCADMIATAQSLRRERDEIVMEPASLNVPGWDQADYLKLWEIFIQRFASCVIFMPGWQYSAGSVTEYGLALAHGVPTQTTDGSILTPGDAVELFKEAREKVIRNLDHPAMRRLAEAIEQATLRIAQSTEK